MLSSHERCQVFGLLPQHRADMSCLSQASLTEVRLRNARLCAQALPVMEMLYEQLIHAHSMVLLTDASGVVLHALGDPGFLERAQRVALAPGAIWSEAVKGTNAVGTTLMTEAPTVVNGQDHYLREFHFLTCSAAPVFDHKGALLGVINVSGDRRSYHPHTLALATMAARMIETQWFNDLFRQSLRLHIHPTAVSLGTLREGLLALDDTGRVVGVNRRAIDILGQTAVQLRRSALPALFGIDLAGLLEHTHSYPDRPLQLALARSPRVDGRMQTGLGEMLVAAHVEAGGTAPAQSLHAVLSLGQSAWAAQGTASAAAPQAEMARSQTALTAATAALDLAAALTTSLEAAGRPQARLPASESGHYVSSDWGRSDTTVAASHEASHTKTETRQPAPGGSQAMVNAATLRQTELQAIQAAVLSCRGNLASAARQLGIGRSTLYRKLKDVPSQAAN